MTGNCRLLSLLALTCLGCSSDSDPTTSLNTPEATITARLSNVTHLKGDVVWGRLIITGTSRKLISADIDCFFLNIGNSASQAPWINNGMDTPRSNYPASGGKVSVPVYWPMENFANGTDAELGKGTLEIKPSSLGSCFEFGP